MVAASGPVSATPREAAPPGTAGVYASGRRGARSEDVARLELQRARGVELQRDHAEVRAREVAGRERPLAAVEQVEDVQAQHQPVVRRQAERLHEPEVP